MLSLWCLEATVALTFGADMEAVSGPGRLPSVGVRILRFLVTLARRSDDGGLGGKRDAILDRGLIVHDVLDAIGPGKGGARQRVAVFGSLRGFALAQLHVGPAAAGSGLVAGAGVGEHPGGAHFLHAAAEERVDHRDVADDDRDECFSASPAARLLRSIRAGLMQVILSIAELKSASILRTVRMRTQRRMPAIMTNIPPLNMTSRRYFLLVGMRALHNSCEQC